jgi:hypothetical protein
MYNKESHVLWQGALLPVRRIDLWNNEPVQYHVTQQVKKHPYQHCYPKLGIINQISQVVELEGIA